MAEVNLPNNLDEIVKGLENVTAGLADVQKSQDATNQSVKEGTETTSGLAKGFRGVGAAVKAAGLFLLFEAFNFLKTAIGESQIAVDAFTTVFNVASTITQDFISFVSTNASVVSDFFSSFELPTISEIGTAIQENLQERFESAIEVLGFLGQAAQRFFSGDFSGALESAQNAGKELIDVYTGVDNTFDRVVDTVVGATEAIVSYAKETINTAVSLTTLANAALIANAQLAVTRAENEAGQETLRRSRDDTTRSIEDRIESSRQLGIAIEEDLRMRNLLAQADVDAAKLAVENNNSIANQVLLLEAEARQIEITAEVEGRRSEQNASNNGLLMEQQTMLDETRETRETRELEVLEAQGAAEDALFDARVERAENQDEIDQINHERKIARIEREMVVEDEAAKAQMELQENVLDAAAGIGDALTTLAGENEELAIAGLIVEGAAGVARTIVNYEAGKALAIGTLGPIPGAIAAAAFTVSQVVAVASSIGATIRGIQAIRSKSEGAVAGVAGGGGSSSIPFGPTTATNLQGAQAPSAPVAGTSNTQTPSVIAVPLPGTGRNSLRSATEAQARLDNKQMLRRGR